MGDRGDPRRHQGARARGGIGRERGAPAPDRRERRPRLHPVAAGPARLPLREPQGAAPDRRGQRGRDRRRPGPRPLARAPRRPRGGGGGVPRRCAPGAARGIRAPAAHLRRPGGLGARGGHARGGARRAAAAHGDHDGGRHGAGHGGRGAARGRGCGPGGQRLQEPVPVADEPRAAHPAERRAGLRPAAQPAARGHRARRGGVVRAHRWSAPARADQRRARHLPHRGRRDVAQPGADPAGADWSTRPCG